MIPTIDTMAGGKDGFVTAEPSSLSKFGNNSIVVDQKLVENNSTVTTSDNNVLLQEPLLVLLYKYIGSWSSAGIARS